MKGLNSIFFLPLLVIPCEVAWSIAGKAPLRVHLLNSQSPSHSDLQCGVIRNSFFEVTGNVQPLIFPVGRLNFLGVGLLIR